MNSWREDIRNYIVGAVSTQLQESSPQAEQPASIKTALRPHQLSLLAAARSLEAKANMNTIDLQKPQLLTRYGVIGDRVGAGKSLVALGLVRDPPVKQSQLTLKEGGVARLIGLRQMPAVQTWDQAWSDLITDCP